MRDRIAYLMCELQSRDLDSRILIAGHLLNAGVAVVVGQQWAMYGNLQASNAPAGACLIATANKSQVPVMAAWRAGGSAVILSDQEGLPFADEGFLINIDADALSNCDLFLAQNDAHRKILAARYPDAAARIVTAGSPRVDLLGATAHPRHLDRPYVLFNTSFGLVNSVWGTVDDSIARLLAGAEITKEDIDERVRVERAAYAELTALMKWTLEKTDVHVVVRPHPSENAKAWQTILPASPRLSVVTGSDPVPWMQHALLTVHSESTTGIEAALLGVRCLNVSPSPAWSRRFVMAKVNATVASAGEAVSLITALFKDGTWPQSAPRLADQFPRGGAEATARHIAESLKGASPLDALRWQRADRTEAQRAKISVTVAEFGQRAGIVFQNAGLTLTEQPSLMELDDSLYLLAPASKMPAVN